MIMNKKILGLDLGVTSIGWAMISEREISDRSILGMGSRIIPLSTDDKDEFISGNAISKNQDRTRKRTQRKGYDRYQLRRDYLTDVLSEHNMMPGEALMHLSSLELYGLRGKAVKQKVELTEFGRILYHLNQKRGYKSSRAEANLEKKDTEYVAAVKSRHNQIKDAGLTIGQYFYQQLLADKYYRIKDQVFPREAYIEEFDAICKEQKKHHTVLTDQVILKIRNEIIYYQRKLKSQKGLVSVCEFEGIERVNDKGNAVLTGPKVAPRSSPLFQLCRIWENINNISIKIKNPEGSKYKWADYTLSIDEKRKLADYLNTHPSISAAELLKQLNLKKDNVYLNKQLAKGLKGNTTYTDLAAVVKDPSLLRFEAALLPRDKKAFLVDRKSGEVIRETDAFVVSPDIEKEPLYRLWHIVYSIKDMDECKRVLVEKLKLTDEEATALSKLDFSKDQFGDKSARAMRKILPFLMQGYNYADSCTLAGYNHSSSLTNEEKAQLETSDSLDMLPKNSLRQPVVEKILNQMINLVNAIIGKYGKPDEIRVELARELKASKDERNEAERQNSLNKKLNAEISKRLCELGLPETKKFIQKYKFIFPARDKKWSEAYAVNQCIYCGDTFEISEALSGDNFDVDHIIPQTLLFDDSQTNKVLVHRKCNKDKNNLTAYDYIAAKGDQALSAFLARVDHWYTKGIISYGKMQRLKTSYNEYLERKKEKKETAADKRLWENFIERQLRETAYIARKAKQLLMKICTNVYSTEGNVTSKLRNLWGWDDVLPQLQLPRFKALQLTEIKEVKNEHGNTNHQKEEIIGWKKRDDHRHHALDALVIACTKQGFIQRINTLNASEVRIEMKKEIEEAGMETKNGGKLLDNYLSLQQPFTTQQVKDEIEKVLISFKAGKKVASTGVRKAKMNGRFKVVQRNIIVPRGALSEESVYGKIRMLDKNKALKYLFENPGLIFKQYIRDKVKERLTAYEGNTKKAIASLKKDPIYLDNDNTKVLEYATCYREEVVMKYPVDSIKKEHLESIVDEPVRKILEERLKKHNYNSKEAFKNLQNDPVWYNEELKIPVRTVRRKTNLTAVEPVKKDKTGRDIGFVKPGNNHHIALYMDENGKMQEHLCTFWHAVDRKKYLLPVIIKNPAEVWDKVLTNKENYPESFLQKLPNDKWKYVESLQQNEMFLLGMTNEEFIDAINRDDRALLSKHLYSVWSISESDYWFKHHLETKNTELKSTEGAKESKRYFRFKSITAFQKENPIKVKINCLGDIASKGRQ